MMFQDINMTPSDMIDLDCMERKDFDISDIILLGAWSTYAWYV